MRRHRRWSIASIAGGVALVGLVAVSGSSCGPGGFDPTGNMAGMMGMGMMGERNAARPATTPLPMATPGGNASMSYREDVQPIFSRSCVTCHGGTVGLWLDSYESVLAGSSRGPVIAPGLPEQSELYKRVTGTTEPRMPLNLPPLAQRDIETIRVWIAEGTAIN